MIFASLNVYAGGMHGGGGVGVRCNGILEPLDLFEAKQSGMDLIPEPDTDEMAIQIMTERFAGHFWNPETIPMPNYVSTLRSLYFNSLYWGHVYVGIFQPRGPLHTIPIIEVQSLPLSNDFGKVVIPRHCHLEQVLYFDDQAQMIKVVPSKLKELTRLGRMAFALHEVSYLYFRLSPMSISFSRWGIGRDNTSEEARNFVGNLLLKKKVPSKSTLVAQEIRDKMMPTRCTDDGPGTALLNAFYSSTVNSRYFWSFKVLQDYWTPYLTYVEFPFNFESEMSDLQNGQFSARGEVFYNDGTPKPMDLVIEVKKRRGEPATMTIIHPYVKSQRTYPIDLSCELKRPL
jgi:hypothetical protein